MDGARIRSGEYRVNPLFIIIELFGSVILSNNIASLALSFFCILLLAGWVHRRRKRRTMMTGWSHLMWYSITFNGIQLEYAEIETEECGCLWGWLVGGWEHTVVEVEQRWFVCWLKKKKKLLLWQSLIKCDSNANLLLLHVLLLLMWNPCHLMS